MGAFPRVAYWDEDDRKDLLIGDTMGEIHLFRNIGTEAAPEFGADELLMVGPAGEKLAIDVGIRSTPLYQDWNADGRRDLIVGAWDGRVHLFINEGTDTAPDFITTAYAQTPAGDLVVDTIRSSPVFRDLDEDGLPDLLCGNTEGQILFYRNIGTEGAPLFDGFELVTAAGVPIDFASIPRSRPFLCDWTGDGYLDLLVGISDGGVHLFQGAPTAVASLPPTARLGLPWPNPANPRVDLLLQVERAGRMRVAVHDGAGRFVKTLFAGRAEAGSLDLRWDGRDEAGRELPSGLYLIHLRGAEAASARKVLLLR